MSKTTTKIEVGNTDNVLLYHNRINNRPKNRRTDKSTNAKYKKYAKSRRTIWKQIKRQIWQPQCICTRAFQTYSWVMFRKHRRFNIRSNNWHKPDNSYKPNLQNRQQTFVMSFNDNDTNYPVPGYIFNSASNQINLQTIQPVPHPPPFDTSWYNRTTCTSMGAQSA